MKLRLRETNIWNWRNWKRMRYLVKIVIGVCFVSLFMIYTTKQEPTWREKEKNLLDVEDGALEELTNETFINKQQDDPSLVSYVRHQLLVPPSKEEYNLQKPEQVHFSQYGQCSYAEDNFLKGLEGGFFLEAGALDGEYLSNTLYFEKFRGWTGLLVEPDPKEFKKLMSRHRKAYCINAGFSFNVFSGTAKFRQAEALGKVVADYEKGVTVKMIPVQTMLAALEIKQIDFFSLDVEGAELQVMALFPWDKVKVRLMVIEVNHVPGGIRTVVKFMEQRGFTFLGARDYDAWFGWRELLEQNMNVDEFLKKNDVALQLKNIK